MIREVDLHTHTTASDGTSTPLALVAEARRIGLRTLAITDHDTFAGYDEALHAPGRDGLELVCGIELSVRPPAEADQCRRTSLHLLAYFPVTPPSAAFRRWLDVLHATRRQRNERLSQRLAEFGMDVPLEEVEALGRSIAGRAHFARIMVRKGYVTTIPEAFDLYLGDAGAAYVPRQDPTLEEAIHRICEAGGVACLAHPVRIPLPDHATEEELIARLQSAGMQALEVYHSDHEPEDVARYRQLAARYGLAATGGSDFHGDVKPEVQLGSGRNGNLAVPHQVVEDLRRAVNS